VKLDIILYVADNNRLNTQLSLIACFINRYNNTLDRFTAVVIFFILNNVRKFMVSECNNLPPAWIICVGICFLRVENR
jgi:hypothetical protein